MENEKEPEPMRLNQEILTEWFVSEEEAEEVAAKDLIAEKRIQYLKGWLAGHASHNEGEQKEVEGELLVLDAVLAAVPKRQWVIRDASSSQS